MRISALTAQPVPWKNGGGVTRELALHQEDGHMVWRLSLAEISRSGPFSAFPGLARIHCIVEGAGHTLSNSETQLQAWPLKPLCFDGGMEFDSRLREGPCKAFNVIYDPVRVTADAAILRDGALPDAAGSQVFFVVSGSLNLAGQGHFAPGEGIVLESTASGRISDGGVVIQLRILPV
ncbi:HutD family protein [Leisingera sp. F5]|uniref:HutD/Ves family protein n=1 Tax=Leisingera sp. F5 TaxID=1813816 RepID=UPI000A5E2A23|nr:HutD family protein [Leisingera sp. F5]